MRPSFFFTLLLVAPVCMAQPAEPGTSFRVLDYRVDLRLDIAQRTVRGHTTVRIEDREPLAGRSLSFDAGSLDIHSVRVDGAIVTAARSGQQVLVPVSAATTRRRHEIDFFYTGQPRFGLEFQPERNEAYTIFSTSQWMVCADDPAVRAPLAISIEAPESLTVVATGELQSRSIDDDGQATTTFALRDAMPSFLYGFAAGPYRTAMHGKVRAYSMDLGAAELAQVAHRASDMLDYMGSRAGRAYAGAFTQMLVGKTIGQEAAGMSLVPESYGRRLLAAGEGEPTGFLLAAHEIAHQWWGARVTNRSWNDFWLNEGFAVFMAATYVEHLYGRDAYERIVQGWRTRVKELRERGHDHALVYPEWNSPTADDRAVVYQKGALVLHLMRERLGERKFWKGVRAYVARFDGRPVDTAGFQRAMEQATGTDLRSFFDSFVYGASEDATL